ncbi:hypothetical protein M758_9G169700 [Ceratodon purpureus]|nr:hypothetical protein M758_9G169700 [Ceratodon purpureus]
MRSDWKRVLDGERSHLLDYAHHRLQKIAERCWHEEPSQRPTFEVLGDDLEVVLFRGTSQSFHSRICVLSILDPGQCATTTKQNLWLEGSSTVNIYCVCRTHFFSISQVTVTAV